MPIDTELRAPLPEAAARATELAAMGFDGVFTFEGPHDVFLPLALAADSGLELMTNIAVAFPRSPVHLAHLAYDLQVLSRGRFRLGLGSQVRAHVERRYGGEWSRPAARMREYVLAVKAVLHCWETGGPLDFRGEFTTHTLMPPVFNPGPNPYGPPRILMAGVGPLMTRAAAEVADGYLIHPFNSDAFVRATTLPAVRRGLADGGRERPSLEVCHQFIVGAGRDEAELSAARAGVRQTLAFYGSTPAYRPVLEAEGQGELQPELAALVRQGRWAELPGLIDDGLLAAVGVVGTPAEVAAAITRRTGGIADRIGFYLPYRAEPDCVAEILDALRGGARLGSGDAVT
ncbi:TIGR03617 family F420-dependent LLM class oxidoreductase [Actinomadura scrupuli]|uniref:TIGR03617 family F420-dependent LLM class oxidoreductase n=1 Tax=Actinomadura scrupuli TaxID=559629 RepID=UPI003D9714F0